MLTGPELVVAAERTARLAHAGQVDKAGEPYAGHLSRVAARLAQEGHEVVAAGWLHDAVEDTGTTSADLLAAGISERAVHVVELLTRTGKPDEAYYAAIRNDPLEQQAKLRAKHAKAYLAGARGDGRVHAQQGSLSRSSG